MFRREMFDLILVQSYEFHKELRIGNHHNSTDQQRSRITYDTAAELIFVPPVDTPLPDNDMGGNPVDTLALLVSPGVAQSGSP